MPEALRQQSLVLTVGNLASKCPGEVAGAWWLQEAGRDAARGRGPNFAEPLGTFGTLTHSVAAGRGSAVGD